MHRVRVFGSTARGTERPDSDVDPVPEDGLKPDVREPELGPSPPAARTSTSAGSAGA
ncbi:nucleotidyltransferase domain-containing protein [Kineococcus esterisolvens]|uniref:nucleotidyltransferase domain-containing protein n=1 Tax=unclassified Kineococcus TaxID=2621656 RepID=UPI003D7E08EF